MSQHEFQYPTVTELPVVRERVDRDTFNLPDSYAEPAEDYSECIIHFAKRIARVGFVNNVVYMRLGAKTYDQMRKERGQAA